MKQWEAHIDEHPHNHYEYIQNYNIEQHIHILSFLSALCLMQGFHMTDREWNGIMTRFIHKTNTDAFKI